jgi:hypothetical protein
MIIGALVFVVGTCIGNVYVQIAGGAIAGVGLLLFILWAIFCAAFTACGVMQTVQCLLAWMVGVVAPILTALVAIFGGKFSACAAAAAITWGGWGTILVWLEAIMRKVHCETKVCF